MRPDDVLDASVDRRELGPVMAARVYAAAQAQQRARARAQMRATLVAVLGWSLVFVEAAGWALLWVWLWRHR